MQSTHTIASLFLTGIILFSVLTPEPGEVQGYERTAFPTFVESDAEFASLDSATVTDERQVRPGYLPFVEQVLPALVLTVSSVLYRAPPLSFLS